MGLVNHQKADAKPLQVRYDSFVLKAFRGGKDDFGCCPEVFEDCIALLFSLTASYADAVYSGLGKL